MKPEVPAFFRSVYETEDLGDLWWMTQARCAEGEVDPDEFFPEQGDPADKAKQVCARCPVREPCLEYAIARPGLKGIWGGVSERHRRPLRQQQREKEAA